MLSFVALSFSGCLLLASPTMDQGTAGVEELETPRRRMMWTDEWQDKWQDQNQWGDGNVNLNLDVRKYKDKNKNKLKKKQKKGATDNSNMPVEINQEKEGPFHTFMSNHDNDNRHDYDNETIEPCRKRRCKNDKITVNNDGKSTTVTIEEEEPKNGDDDWNPRIFGTPTQEPVYDPDDYAYYLDQDDPQASNLDNNQAGTVAVQAPGPPPVIQSTPVVDEPTVKRMNHAEEMPVEESPADSGVPINVVYVDEEKDAKVDVTANSKPEVGEAPLDSSKDAKDEGPDWMMFGLLAVGVLLALIAATAAYILSSKRKNSGSSMKGEKYKTLGSMPKSTETTARTNSNSWIDDDDEIDERDYRVRKSKQRFREERVAVKKYRP